MTTTAPGTDPVVVACVARHSAAPIIKCSGCGVCGECDVTVQPDEYGDVRCETCQNAHGERREDELRHEELVLRHCPTRKG